MDEAEAEDARDDEEAKEEERSYENGVPFGLFRSPLLFTSSLLPPWTREAKVVGRPWRSVDAWRCAAREAVLAAAGP